MLRKRHKKGFYIALILMPMGIAIIFLGLRIFEPPDKRGVFSLIIGLIIIYIGVMFGYILGDTAKNLIKAAELIEGIGPDDLVITPKYVVGHKGSIYFLVKWTNYMLYMINFKDLQQVNDRKIRLHPPKTIFAPHKYIEHKKVFVTKGTFTIPISANAFGRGNGVMYCLSREKLKYSGGIRISVDISPDQELLLKIIEELKKENVH